MSKFNNIQNNSKLQNIIIKSRITNNTTEQNLDIINTIFRLRCVCGEYKLNLHGSSILIHEKNCLSCHDKYCKFLCIGNYGTYICFNCIKKNDIPLKLRFLKYEFITKICYKEIYYISKFDYIDKLDNNFSHLDDDFFPLNLKDIHKIFPNEKKVVSFREFLDYLYETKSNKKRQIKKLLK